MGARLVIVLLAVCALAGMAVPRWMNPPPSVAPVATRSMPSRPFAPPRYTVDRLQVLDLLENRDFGALTTLLNRLQERVLRDPAAENDLALALDAFDTGATELEPLFDDWIRTRPNEPMPRLGRSTYLVRAAFDRRGVRLAKQTSPQQFVEMDAQLKRALEDAQAALQQNARLAFAYIAPMRAAKAHGDEATCKRMMTAALAIAPASYHLRVEYMMCLLPRWGGSYEEMDQFALMSQRWRDQNPRLAALGGFSAWDRGRILRDDGRYEEALHEFNHALEFGDAHCFYEDRAVALSGLEAYRDAVANYERGLVLFPQEPECLVGRAFARSFEQDDVARIDADVALAKRVDPGNAGLAWFDARDAHVAEAQGSKLLKASRYDEAIAKLTWAHEHAPGRTHAMSLRGEAYAKKNDLIKALADYEEAVRLEPENFYAYQGLDWVLVHQAAWDRIIGHWSQYIALVPRDPRAYMERGGAYSQKGDRSSAVADASKACELGDKKGCEISRRYGDG